MWQSIAQRLTVTKQKANFRSVLILSWILSAAPDFLLAVLPGFLFDNSQISQTHRQQLGKEQRKLFFFVCCGRFSFILFGTFWRLMLERVRWRFLSTTSSVQSMEMLQPKKNLIVLIENSPNFYVLCSLLHASPWCDDFSPRFHCRLSIQSTIQWKLSFPFFAMASFKHRHSSLLSVHFCFCWWHLKSDRP